ncbi:hypothetical protein D3C87_1036910 [compost metagenome]
MRAMRTAWPIPNPSNAPSSASLNDSSSIQPSSSPISMNIHCMVDIPERIGQSGKISSAVSIKIAAFGSSYIVAVLRDPVGAAEGCDLFRRASISTCLKTYSSAFQISVAYSRMVRSDENQPIRAVLNTAERHHSFESCQWASTRIWACQ